MSTIIDKETVRKLSELARIEPEMDSQKNEKLISDLSSILDYFGELKKIDTEGVSPVIGGASVESVFRPDEVRDEHKESLIRSQFPESEDGYLKIPPVFE